MPDLSWRDMDLAALDAAYNNSAGVANSAEIVAGWQEKSAILRGGEVELDIAYGERPREKFDYFAPYWGIPILGPAGVLLWWRDEVSHYVPGIVLNAAYIMHTDEALLAVLFLFFVHWYNVHYAPEKFPAATVWMRIIGAWMRAPATSLSRVRSKAPS